MTGPNPSAGSPLSSDASFMAWLETKHTRILVLASLAALLWITLYLQFTADDAFISFRYGANLAAHHVWNWNAIGTREEAYTSALYAALSAVPALLHISPALFFKFAGLGCIGVMLYRLRTLPTSGYATLLGILLIAFDPWVWVHAFSGLETPLYMLLLLEMAICVHRAPSTSAVWAYALFLILPLTRPEGVLFACVGVTLFWHRRGDAPRRYGAFGVTLLLGLGYFYARWRYFGHLLPNPYYFKLAPTGWNETLANFIKNLNDSKGYFLVLLLAFAFARHSYVRIFAGSAFLLLLLLYAPHDMHMNYADRFYFQVAFPFLLFFLIAEDLAPIARIAAVLAAFCIFSINVTYLRSALRYFPLRAQSDVDLGRRLAPFAPGHTILTPNAGAIPYYSGWVAYDFFGLGTYRMSHDGLSIPLLTQLHPDLILVESTRPGPGVLNDPTYSSKQTEVDFIRSSGQYDYVGESGTQQIYNIEFLRRDTPQRAELVRALQANRQRSAESRVSLKDLLFQRYVPWRN
jgi:arabinofuranosyltransferase